MEFTANASRAVPVVRRREHHGMLRFEPLDQLEAAHLRHLDVEKQDIASAPRSASSASSGLVARGYGHATGAASKRVKPAHASRSSSTT